MPGKIDKSKQMWEEAQKYIAGGVNSPVRALKVVDEKPIFINHGKGAYIHDVDGNSYLDYVCSWGPLILGHANPQVLEIVKDALIKGTSFGIPTPEETELARKLVQLVPSLGKVRLVNSGTEATMTAIRLARGVTGRDRIVKFSGCYHGHVDSLLVKAGSGAATFGIPDSAGIPVTLADLTITLPYNNIDQVASVISAEHERIACVIVEPVAGNMGVIPPHPKFLPGLRELCTCHNIILIFDEVITGFRLSLGGAQEVFNITPDLTCLGKIIGGGFPIGAYGGKSELMDNIAPEGPVYQAGTLSGNPVAVAAGLATLSILEKQLPYGELERKTRKLATGLEEEGQRAGIPVTINQVGSTLTVFFKEGRVGNYEEARQSDLGKFARFFRTMRENEINIAPSQFEAFFLSTAHTDEDIEKTIEAGGKAFTACK